MAKVLNTRDGGKVSETSSTTTDLRTLGLEHNVYSPYIELKIGGPNGLSLSTRDGRPDYFISLSNKRIVQKANNSTIRIKYVPQGNEDPNLLEAALSKTDSSDGNQILYRYGYPGYRSNYYRGMVTGYKVNLTNGYLEYTLSVTSYSILYNYGKLTNPIYSIPKRNSDSIRLWWLGIVDSFRARYSGTAAYDIAADGNATTFVEREIGRPLYDYNASIDVQANTFTFLSSDVIWTMKRVVDDYMSQFYEFVNEAGTNFTVSKEGVSLEGDNIISYLSKIASNLMDNDSPDTHYRILVDDSLQRAGGKGKIKLVKYTTENKNPTHHYAFEWNSKDANVISFSPGFEGVVAVYANVDVDKDIYQNQRVIDVESGQADIQSYQRNLKTITNTVSPANPSSPNYNSNFSTDWNDLLFDEKLLETLDWFLAKANYPYTADMTVLGIPDENFEICSSYVYITPLINGRPHHTQGLYMVVGITDNISTNGFTTDLKLIKMIDKDKIYNTREHQIVKVDTSDRGTIYEGSFIDYMKGGHD